MTENEKMTDQETEGAQHAEKKASGSERFAGLKLFFSALTAVAVVCTAVFMYCEMTAPTIGRADGAILIQQAIERFSHHLTTIAIDIPDSVKAGINRSGARGHGDPAGSITKWEMHQGLDPLADSMQSHWFSTEQEIHSTLALMGLPDSTILTVDFLSHLHDPYRRAEFMRDSLLAYMDDLTK